MSRITRTRPSPAMVVALIALFVSLSGVAWAATTLKTDSITSKYLKNGKAVKNVDVVNDTLQGDKIKESTLAQVPSALKADSAGTATTAGSATTAGDAELLDHLNSSDFLRTNGTAANAARLDGFKSADFLQADATAANADLLDGLDSSAFLRSAVTKRESTLQEVNSGFISGAVAGCEPGEQAIAGGVVWTTTPTPAMPMLESTPITNFSGWTVTVGNASGELKKYRIVAICVAG